MYKIIEVLKTNLKKNNTDILSWMVLADAYEEDMNESAKNVCKTIIDCLKWAKEYNRKPNYGIYYVWDRVSDYEFLRLCTYSLSLIPAVIYQYLRPQEGFKSYLAYSNVNEAWTALFQAWIEYKSKEPCAKSSL